MFWRILKNDLKRRKTMNAILLVFVMISAMFAAASLNSISAVTGGIEHFFELAEVPDAVVSSQYKDVEEQLRELPSVSDIKAEPYYCSVSAGSFRYKGKKLDNCVNPPSFLSDEHLGVKYFDTDNNVIKGVEKGSFYATLQFTNDTDIKPGDEVELEMDGLKRTLTYKGRIKSAVSSPALSANAYIILDDDDFEYFRKSDDASVFFGNVFYVTTSDTKELADFCYRYDDVYLTTRDEVKSYFIYDMLIAYVLLSISVILMATAFVVLRFTIGFTISEEFREIGVMKAVGINNGAIRRLYIIKYLAISVVGALIGFAASVPLSSVMMDSVSNNIVLGSENGVILGAVSSISVVAVILLFCYLCTGKVKKLSPIDAVRNGQTGERFRKKSIMHLGSSKLPATGFLAFNDVTSAPKQFAIITLIFTLCMLMMTSMSNFSETLKSDKILFLFNVPASDAHIGESQVFKDIFLDPLAYEHIISDTEKKLADNGIPAKCSMTFGSVSEGTYNDNKLNLRCLVTKGNIDYNTACDNGSAPQKSDEVILTQHALDELGAEIGDRVNIKIGDSFKEFLVTGTFSTFMGTDTAVFHKDVDFTGLNINNSCGIQVRFDGSPDADTVSKNIEKLKDIYETKKIYTSSELIEGMTQLSGTMNAIKYMAMILTVVVTGLIVMLMERSFISKEKSEIALMKAVGIKSGSIFTQHTLRFLIASVLACAAASAVIIPLSNMILIKVFSLIGDIKGVSTDFDPVEIFAVCPLILISVTFIGSYLTSIHTRKIKASDTSSIE